MKKLVITYTILLLTFTCYAEDKGSVISSAKPEYKKFRNVDSAEILFRNMEVQRLLWNMKYDQMIEYEIEIEKAGEVASEQFYFKKSFFCVFDRDIGQTMLSGLL